YLLAKHCGIDVHSVHAYMLGEHGDGEFAAWSMTNMAGMPIREYCAKCGKCGQCDTELAKIEEEVRNSAYHIIGYKGATWFAVGLALVRIAEAILRNQSGVLTVSAELQGEYGLSDVTVSVPCIVGQRGIEKVLEVNFPPEEQSALERSAKTLQDALRAIGV
ncbi:TPA: L-lactate dehydrogenase, partial [Candidatus Sumerlaeota bacterium]|nr:L-lactate dehydrogenase [Candidatus Sumerlaeota bacterium]